MATAIEPNAVPITALKYHQYADFAAYVLTALAAYQGFAAAHPHIAFYFGMAAAGAYAAGNWLASKGD